MRRTILRIVVFAALLMALDRLVYAGAMFLRDDSGVPEGVDLLYDARWDPQVIFFGDSRTKHSFDLEVIEAGTGLSAYGFAQSGASPEQSLFMLKEALRNGHRPRVVVFEADPLELSPTYGVFDKAPFRDHLLVVPDAADLLSGTQPSLQQRASAFAVTWLLRTASLPNRLPELWQRWRDRSDASERPAFTFACGEKAPGCRFYHGGVTFLPSPREMVPIRYNYELGENRMALYRYVAQLAEEQDFWLILDEVPRFHGSQMYPATQKARSDAFFCRVADSHPHVVFAQLTHFPGAEDDPSLYFDRDHFNADGAKKVSDILAPLIAKLAAGTRGEPCVRD
jgi:hypothetical protein